MIRLEMKNCNTILTEIQQKSQQYHQVKLINISILQVKKHDLPVEAKFTYSSLRKALENKQRNKSML